MERKNELYFCCCEGNMCNQNFSWIPQPTAKPTEPSVIHGILFNHVMQCLFFSKINCLLQHTHNNILIITFSELEPVSDAKQQAITLALLIAIPMLLTISLFSFWWLYRRRKLGYFNEVVF